MSKLLPYIRKTANSIGRNALSNLPTIRRIASFANVNTKEPQRNYLFEAVILSNVGDGDFEDIRFYVKTIGIPQKSRDPIVLEYMDQKFTFSGKDTAAHTINVTFWDDEALTIYRFFHRWMNAQSDPEFNRSATKRYYTKTLSIQLKDRTDFVVTGTVNLSSVFPTEINEINLNYEGSEIMEVTVTMSFESMEIDYKHSFETDAKTILENILGP